MVLDDVSNFVHFGGVDVIELYICKPDGTINSLSPGRCMKNFGSDL